MFSLLAIATSFIGFVLGLSDFIADYLKARGPSCVAVQFRTQGIPRETIVAVVRVPDLS